MKRNSKIPRLTVIAEDEATSLLAQGFIGNSVVCRQNRCNPVKYTRGWESAVRLVKSLRLDVQTKDYVVLIIDYDRRGRRRYPYIRDELSGLPYGDRVYVLGPEVEAEKLLAPMRAHFGDASLDLEGVGGRIAQECRDKDGRGNLPGKDSRTAWEEPCLRMNIEVVRRLERDVRPFLFNP